jgi:hypothetical protein
MKIIKNEKLIKRNAKIGQYSSLAGILVIVGTMVFLIQFARSPESASQTNIFILWGVLFVGIALSQISMYFGTRWGRRPDEALDKGLKGLPGDSVLYHYSSPVPHLIVGSAGLWILLPYHLRGTVSYRKNRWRVGGGGVTQGYLRIFGQETIGRPDIEFSSQASSLEKHLRKNLEEGQVIPPINGVLVFLDDKVEIASDSAPLPAIQVKKLKDFIRKAAKDSQLAPSVVEKVKATLPEK